jgi:protein Mpv17
MMLSFRLVSARRIVTEEIRRLNDLMERHPLKTSLWVTGTKAGLADAFVQTQVERKSELDPQRLAAFTLFGFGYQGGFQYWMMTKLWERIFPGAQFVPVVQKILATNLISDPVFFFPTFYTLREALAYPQKAASAPSSVVSSALAKYRMRCLEDWRNTWAVWFPGHAITYGLMPLHLRMPWVATLSFGYLCILSYTRGDRDK